jgi:hypothetical protein
VAGDGGVRWILDPIDGTVNYLYGIPLYAGLAGRRGGRGGRGGRGRQRRHRGRVDGDPGRRRVPGGAPAGRLRVTDPRSGAAGDRVRIRRRPPPPPGAGTGEAAGARARRAAMGAAAIDLCLAAEGTVDMYYEKGLNVWDYAAGGLVATEAGLLVTGSYGRPGRPGFPDGRPARPAPAAARPPGRVGRRRRCLSPRGFSRRRCRSGVWHAGLGEGLLLLRLRGEFLEAPPEHHVHRLVGAVDVELQGASLRK